MISTTLRETPGGRALPCREQVRFPYRVIELWKKVINENPIEAKLSMHSEEYYLINYENPDKS